MIERKMKLRYLPFQQFKNSNQISFDEYQNNNNPLDLSAIRSSKKFDQKLFEQKINTSSKIPLNNKFISQVGNP